MQIDLSILIPSTVSRKEMTDALVYELLKQGMDLPIEVLLDWNETNVVGKKRNDLLKRAQGKYIVFVDSDDEVSPNYISLILQQAKSNADCIAINGKITTNGTDERKWFISKRYGTWYEQNGVYFRTPNHISPVKRDLALRAGFPEVAFAEDYEYSKRLFPLLTTEVIINEPLYHYKYVEHK